MVWLQSCWEKKEEGRKVFGKRAEMVLSPGTVQYKAQKANGRGEISLA